MEEKEGINGCGVAVKGDEAPVVVVENCSQFDVVAPVVGTPGSVPPGHGGEEEEGEAEEVRPGWHGHQGIVTDANFSFDFADRRVFRLETGQREASGIIQEETQIGV